MLRGYLLPWYIKMKLRGFMKELASLLESQYYSTSELINLQEEKLKKLIKFAYENVPHYKEKFDNHKLNPSDFRCLDDLQKLPILTKQDIKNDLKKLVSIEQKTNSFIVRRTSGSTGTPFKIIVNSESEMIEGAIFYRFLFSMGYEWGDQIVKVWGAPIIQSNIERIFKTIKDEVSKRIWNVKSFDTYDLDRNTIRKILLLLIDDTAKILRGYVSSIYLIALESIKAGIKVNLKGISTTAEKLFDYQRRAIEKAFHQKIYDHYGCRESGSLAFECEKHSGLHVASEHVVLELLNDDNGVVNNGESGRVVITDLDNYAMPLIRYQNDDLAKWSNNACSCGRNLPLLQHIEGRVYEMLTVPGGKKIHGGFFDEIYIEMKFGDRYLINDLRIIQEDLNNYELQFVMEGELNEEDIRIVKQTYRQYLGDVNIKIKYLKSFPLSKTGKRRFVIPASIKAEVANAGLPDK